MDGGRRLDRPIAARRGAMAVAAYMPVETPLLSFSKPKLRPAFRRKAVVLPLHRKLPALTGTLLLLGLFGIVSALGASLNGSLQHVSDSYGEPKQAIARLLGLGVERVTMSGLFRLNEDEIMAASGISPKSSLPFFNADEARRKLEEVPLVRSVSVRKLYPNDIIITLTERDPHALWQHDGELHVIAADGTVIDTLRDPRYLSLPLVVGTEANTHTKDYLALLELAGPLKSRIKAGMLVSGRRWTLKIDNGIDVRLPEHGVETALAKLAGLERDQHILSKDIIAIDLRMPDRIVVRLTEEAATARAETLQKKPARGKGVET